MVARSLPDHVAVKPRDLVAGVETVATVDLQAIGAGIRDAAQEYGTNIQNTGRTIRLRDVFNEYGTPIKSTGRISNNRDVSLDFGTHGQNTGRTRHLRDVRQEYRTQDQRTRPPSRE